MPVSRPLQLLSALIVILLLAGCAAETSDLPVLQEKQYSQDILNQAADELDALPDGSALLQLITDYAVLRAQVRALSD